MAVGTFVWGIRADSVPFVGAVLCGAAILALAWLLWRSKERFLAGG